MAQAVNIQRSYRTSRGLVYVQNYCSAEFISCLDIDGGFGAIVPQEKLRSLLLEVASLPGGNVIAAYVDPFLLVGYVLMAKPQPVVWQGKTYRRRWEKSEVLYELGSIEVSRNFRELGVAGKMVGVLCADDLEDRIVIALELPWHWDVYQTEMDKWRYRNMMVDLLSAAGFVEMRTDDPEVNYDQASVFMARIGSRVSPKDVGQFDSLLFEEHGKTGG